MPTSEKALAAVEWTLEGPGRLQRTETNLPSPTTGEVLVESVLGAVGPGAERTILHGTCPAVPEGAYPHQPGRLNVVRIVEAPDRTLLGDRGVATLGHRNRALIPYARFLRVPPHVSDELALLGVMAADSWQAIDIASVDRAEDCLVVGGGPAGTLTAWELATHPKSSIRIVETSARRRALLETIRFPREVEIAAEIGPRAYHTVFDCANTPAGFALCQRAARPGGSIVVLADGSHEEYRLAPDFFAKKLYLGKPGPHPDLRGFLHDWFARHDDRDSLVAAAFRERVPFDAFPQAYLETLLKTSDDRDGLLPLITYG